MENLITRLNRAIDVEYDSKNNEVDNLMKLPISERVIKGNTISDLEIEILDSLPKTLGDSKTKNGILSIKVDKNIVTFKKVRVSCKNNLSKFREGSYVELIKDPYSFNLIIIKDDDNNLILESDYKRYEIGSGFQNSSGWRLDYTKVDIRHIVKESTDILRRNASKLKFISEIFYGRTSPKYSHERIEKAKYIIENLELNPTQKKAFINAYSTENFELIQGPPGSGKTWLLAHLAVAFAKEGKKVLITASTHTAINNALQKASTLSGYEHIIKVGKKFQAENLNYDNSNAKNVEDFRKSFYDNNSVGIIVGATCYSPYTKKLKFMDWDTVIFDEAGQLSIPLAIAGMVKGEKYIFIGDHKQLPPIVSQNHNDVVFTHSIFEHLFQFNQGIMLDTTYRMNSPINKFPSKQFYDGKLLPHQRNENWLLNIPNNFKKHQKILDINQPDVLFCHHHNSTHSRSEFEASIIAEFTKEYFDNGLSPKDMAIITPLRAQVREIKKSLKKYDFYKNIKDDLFIDTIEQIQGQERDVIIISMVISDPIKAQQRADFYFNPNRFNVALTRAKKKRIVVANKALFKIEEYDYKLIDLIKNFKDFYKSTNIIEENTGTNDIF